MLRGAIVLACLGISGCATLATPEDWSKRDTLLQAGLTAVIAADAVTTARIRDSATVVETGPVALRVLGRDPRQAETLAYMLGVAYVHYWIARKAPRRWRPLIQSIGIADHGYRTRENCHFGLC